MISLISCGLHISSVLVLSAELRGGIKWLLHKSVTLHKTVILPQIMVAHACAHQALILYENCKQEVQGPDFHAGAQGPSVYGHVPCIPYK